MAATGNDILQLYEKPTVDNSIKKYEDFLYHPIVGTQLNDAGVITITIENHDEYVHPHRSGLLFQGRLVKDNGDALLVGDTVNLTNNGILYLFSNIKLSLSGQEIESINHPGHATSILGLCKYSSGFVKGPGLAQCWVPDSNEGTAAAENKAWERRRDYILKTSVPVGTFSFLIPLDHIFGFAEDYDKVMYGFRYTLSMVRTNSNNAVFSTGAKVGKVELTQISWVMPHVSPNDVEKVHLYKQIKDNTTLEAPFRMRQCDIYSVPETTETTWRLGVRSAPEKPRYILIGLQTDRSEDHLKNAAAFDNCNVKSMHTILNATRYPEVDMLTNFNSHDIARMYKAFTDFSTNFYGLDKLITNVAIDPARYIKLFPLFVFDVSKQSERLTTAIVDITIKMQFHANCAPKTMAYAVVISDRILKIRSDGQKMDVIY